MAFKSTAVLMKNLCLERQQTAITPISSMDRMLKNSGALIMFKQSHAERSESVHDSEPYYVN